MTAESVMPLAQLGGISTLRPPHNDAILVDVRNRRSRSPVGVVEGRAVLPAPVDASLSQPHSACPHFVDIAGGQHLLDKLVVVQVNRDQTSSPVHCRAEDTRSEPRGGDGGNQVAAVVVATPAGGALESSEDIARRVSGHAADYVTKADLAVAQG